MDEQDRESDIRQQAREWLNRIPLRDHRRFDTVSAVRGLNDQLAGLTRRRKGEVRQQLDRDQLSRREFLKVLGLTGIGTVAAIGFVPFLKREIGVTTPTGYAHANVDFDGDVSVSQDGEYEVWTPSGHVNCEVPGGATVENVLIDQSGEGSISLRAQADGWTVRNIGWTGGTITEKNGGRFAFQLRCSVPSGGASATIENVFMEGWGSEMGGTWLAPNHSGTINVHNSYFAGFGNNSIYGSGPGKNGHDNGNIIVESSVSNSSTTGNFRVTGQGARVRNSVVTINDPDCNRGNYPDHPDSYNARPIAARHWDDIVAENCSVYVNPDDCHGSNGAYQAWHCGSGCNSNSSQTVLTVRNCDINADAPNKIGELNGGTVNVEDSLGNSPTTDVLQNGGVPTDAEMAAQGMRQVPALDEMEGKATAPTTAPNTAPNTGPDSDSDTSMC